MKGVAEGDWREPRNSAVSYAEYSSLSSSNIESPS